jgi:hypothetical protein
MQKDDVVLHEKWEDINSVTSESFMHFLGCYLSEIKCIGKEFPETELMYRVRDSFLSGNGDNFVPEEYSVAKEVLHKWYGVDEDDLDSITSEEFIGFLESYLAENELAKKRKLAETELMYRVGDSRLSGNGENFVPEEYTVAKEVLWNWAGYVHGENDDIITTERLMEFLESYLAQIEILIFEKFTEMELMYRVRDSLLSSNGENFVPEEYSVAKGVLWNWAGYVLGDVAEEMAIEWVCPNELYGEINLIELFIKDIENFYTESELEKLEIPEKELVFRVMNAFKTGNRREFDWDEWYTARKIIIDFYDKFDDDDDGDDDPRDTDEWKSIPKEVNDLFNEYMNKVAVLPKSEQAAMNMPTECMLKMLALIPTIQTK